MSEKFRDNETAIKLVSTGHLLPVFFMVKEVWSEVEWRGKFGGIRLSRSIPSIVQPASAIRTILSSNRRLSNA